MEDELKVIRQRFVRYLLFSIIALPVILLLILLLGKYVHVALALVFGFFGICGFVIYDALLFERVISSRCPNCGHKFYTFWRWPLISVFYFFWWNNCSHCKLSGDGKNIENYRKLKRPKG